MTMMQTPAMRLLERYLNLTEFREQLVASNLANVDTPNYRTVDIDFRAEMQRAMNEPDGAPSNPQVFEVPGLEQRPDGNNVSVDRESMLLGQTQLQFQAAVQLWRSEMSNLITAVSEGSKS
jgi:flagellar basal-body rod protein FlgB